MEPQWALKPNGCLDLFHVPQFAETALQCNATRQSQRYVLKRCKMWLQRGSPKEVGFHSS